MSEIYDKKLEKNYGKVQKSELKYYDSNDKILATYNRKIKSIEANTKREIKQQKDLEKNIKVNTKAELLKLKDSQKEKSVFLSQQLRDAKQKQKVDTDIVEKKHKEELSILIDQKKETSTTNTATKREDLKEYKKIQSGITAKEKRAVKRFEGMKTKEKTAIKERKKQADAKIKALHLNRDEEVKEISDTSQQEINSAYEVIAFRREKTDELIEQSKVKHDELKDSIEKEEVGATESYNAKVHKNEIALEEKVARRNKFLQKADTEGDFKNVKLQKREIKQLEQVSDRELKQIKQDFDRLIKDIELKRTIEERRYLEEIAEHERGFAQFKQEQLWRIELIQIEAAESITNIKLETEKKLYAETILQQQIDIDFEVELGRLEKEKQIAINDLRDFSLKEQVNYERDRDTKALVFEMKIAEFDKDITILKNKKEIEKNKFSSAFDEAQVENEIELQILSEDNEYFTTKTTQEEYLSMQKVDTEKQTTIRQEFTDSIDEFSSAHFDRAKEQLEFETLEIENRAKVKLHFLEEQQSILEQEYKRLLTRIENTQKQEEEFYKTAIKQIEKQEKDILKKSVGQQEKEIKKLEAQLAEIEAQEDQLDSSDITSRLQELIDVVTKENESTQKVIQAKSIVMEENINLIESRKQQEKEEAKVLFSRENRSISYAIELLDQNKQAEINEAKARFDKSNNLYKDLKENYKTTMAQRKEEHTRFIVKREDHENSILQIAKEGYENSIALLTETKTRKIASIKDGLLSENNVLESLVKEQKEAYNALQKQNVHKKSMVHNSAEAMLIDREKDHENKVEEIEADYNKIVLKRERDNKQKDNEFKGLMAQVEKSILVEKRKYEDDRRKAQKAYEIELKKLISTINKNLDLESRLV